MAFPVGWPPRPASGVRSCRFFATGTGTAAFQENAFLFGSANKAIATIGSGVNGLVMASVDSPGPAGNAYTIQVVVASAPSTALSAALTGTDILVTLATLASGFPDDAANTATLVAAQVNGLAGISAFASGTGATALRMPEAKKNFFFGGTIIQPTPVIAPGAASVKVEIGTTQYSGSPMGSGDNYVYSSGIIVSNDETAPGTALEVSFDGVNIHGIVPAGESMTFRGRHESGIAVRGVAAFRIHAW